METKASLDTLSKVVTVGIIALFAAISIGGFFCANGNSTIILISTGVLLFVTSITMGCYLFSPQGYVLNPDDLIIKRPLKDRSIKLSDIIETHAVVDTEMKYTLRTFGVGGLFGYYGKFYNPKFGSMTWYTTQRKNRIFIRTNKEEKIIITPDDISLLSRIQEELKKQAIMKSGPA